MQRQGSVQYTNKFKRGLIVSNSFCEANISTTIDDPQRGFGARYKVAVYEDKHFQTDADNRILLDSNGIPRLSRSQDDCPIAIPRNDFPNTGETQIYFRLQNYTWVQLEPLDDTTYSIVKVLDLPPEKNDFRAPGTRTLSASNNLNGSATNQGTVGQPGRSEASNQRDRDNKNISVPPPTTCVPFDPSQINNSITNMIRDIENFRNDFNGPNSALSQTQAFIRRRQQFVNEASQAISQAVNWLINLIRDEVLKKVNWAVNEAAKLLYLNQRFQLREQQATTTDLIACLFNRILDNLSNLISQFLNQIIDRYINVPLCAIETFINEFAGQIIGQILGAVNSLLDNISGLVGEVINITNEVLDAITSILDALTCNVEQTCPELTEWNFLEGVNTDPPISFDISGIANSARSIADRVSGTISDVANFSFNLDINSMIANAANGCNTNAITCGPPRVSFWGGSGSGATGNAIVSAAGDILGVDIVTPGRYTRPPFVSFIDDCGNGRGASATANVGALGQDDQPIIIFTAPTNPVSIGSQFRLRYRITNYELDSEFVYLDLEITNTATNRVINIPGINSAGAELPAGEDITHRLDLTAVNGNDDPDFVDGDGVRSARDRNFLVVDFPEGQTEVRFDFRLLLEYRRGGRNRRVRAIASLNVSRTAPPTPAWTVTPDRTTIPEGDTVTFTIETPANIEDGTLVHYIISGGNNITVTDFVDNRLNSQSNTELGRRLNFGDLTAAQLTQISEGERPITTLIGLGGVQGTGEIDPRAPIINPRPFEIADPITITNGTGTLTKTAARDSNREGSESFTLQLREGQIDGPILATSPSVTITDEPQATPGSGTGVNSVAVTDPGTGYLPSPNGDQGGIGRVWRDRCQTAVQREDGTWERPLNPGQQLEVNVGDRVEYSDGTTFAATETTTITATPCPPETPSSQGNYPVALEISGVTIQNPGSGYSDGDRIIINPSNGAEMRPRFNNGRLIGVDVVRSGIGFTEFPEIFIDSDTGFNARITPIFSSVRTDEDPGIVPPGTPVVQVVDCVGRV
jgi:methyl-accepting chemotaxis protein